MVTPKNKVQWSLDFHSYKQDQARALREDIESGTSKCSKRNTLQLAMKPPAEKEKLTMIPTGSYAVDNYHKSKRGKS